MKRRDLCVEAGAGLTIATLASAARAQSTSSSASRLGTTLTPMGAERAGNADGSIPAWTGGLVTQPLPPNQPIVMPLFTDEKPIYIVGPNNMAQYRHLLTAGTQMTIEKFGLNMKVYPTHRTAAAPQYVYDNTALNAQRARLNPAGGRLGFTNAFGGVPFPIIDTSDPLVGGAQLIWNHLTAWNGSSYYTTFNPSLVMINGQVVLAGGGLTRFYFPYYDPNGTLEDFDGYYSKLHAYITAPASSAGQEELVWHTTNVSQHPDIVWTLLNGQGRVRKAPNEAFDTPNPTSNGISNIDESSCFYGNPSQYDWKYIGKQEMLVPYTCNAIHFHTAQELMRPHFLNPDIIRWEKHRVWIVEATLHPGERNVLARRRFYIDEDTWYALLGEGYDSDGNMVKSYAIYNGCVPSQPGNTQLVEGTFNLITGDYVIAGAMNYPPFRADTFVTEQSPSYFDAQVMAANASY